MGDLGKLRFYERVVLRYPPKLFFNEIAGFKSSSRSYLLKNGVPRHPDPVDRETFAHKKLYQYSRSYLLKNGVPRHPDPVDR